MVLGFLTRAVVLRLQRCYIVLVPWDRFEDLSCELVSPVASLAEKS